LPPTKSFVELQKGERKRRILSGKLKGKEDPPMNDSIALQEQDREAVCSDLIEALARNLKDNLGFDLGYFAFWWLDELSERGYWWVSRLREKTSYELVHVFWQYEGNVDALIWLGAHRADRAGRMARMVRIWDGKMLHTYITNVLDPRQMSMKEIVQLYFSG
jgi:hypothetical protein